MSSERHGCLNTDPPPAVFFAVLPFVFQADAVIIVGEAERGLSCVQLYFISPAL